MRKYSWTIGAMLLLLPLAAGAHGGGQSFDRQVGDLLLDFGCEELEFRVGTEAHCSLWLLRETGPLDWDLVPYDTADVRITPKTGESWNATLHPGSDGKTSEFAYAFGQGGEHRIDLKLSQKGVSVLETTVDLDVTTDRITLLRILTFLEWTTGAAFVGMLAVVLLGKKRPA